MDFIAHIRQKDGKIQTVSEHLHEVRKLSEKFGEKIGVKHLAGLAGLLHDLGKNTYEFKNYIEDAVYNENSISKRGSVDHSTAGGKLLYERYYGSRSKQHERLAIEWIVMSIISHHSGLRDFLSPDANSDFLYRVSEKEISEFDQAVKVFFETIFSEEELNEYFNRAAQEVVDIIHKIKKANVASPFFMVSLIIKYIFSCLIDADRTNTRLFEEDQKTEPEFDYQSFFKETYTELMKKINSLSESEDANHPINQLRRKMSDQCEEFANTPSGIYTLSIPTGGGKTLSSFRYALKHAINYKKHRIIYIVPYTTIIEQNAEEIRSLLKDKDLLLEHHSNVIDDWRFDHEDYDLHQKNLKLAKDNWDSPIIFTTMVQFLNVFFSSGTRNVRRLHNLVNSVIIFDEVQLVPIKCISLFNQALNFLHIVGNSSIVLCTATQPALDSVKRQLKINPHNEIIKDIDQVQSKFKRVEIIDKTTASGLSAVELKDFIFEEMKKVNNILVILNTKTAARKLFEELKSEISSANNDYLLFHLSTNMCPAHRKEELKKIKDSLESKKVICVSTQLIEAGVNISFDCVIRSLAGLDSIAQAAGRCNRHGKDPVRNVYIVRVKDEVLSHLKEIKIGAEVTERILYEFNRNPESFNGDLLSAEVMREYFTSFYNQIEKDFDYYIPNLEHHMYDLLNLNQKSSDNYFKKYGMHFPLYCRQSFATAEEHFYVIDNFTKSILVPYNSEAIEIISQLNSDLDSRELSLLLKKSQQYVVNVYDHEFMVLDRENYVDLLLNGNVYGLKELAYSREYGVDLKGEGSWAFREL